MTFVGGAAGVLDQRLEACGLVSRPREEAGEAKRRASAIRWQVLGIPNPDREWGKLLSDIVKKIEAMPKGDDCNRWSESHTHLYHVRHAWRNDTMHPKQPTRQQKRRRFLMRSTCS
jgi:hypothetical protein